MTTTLDRFVESRGFRNGVFALIILNSAIIGAETYESVVRAIGGLLHIADRIILVAFAIELILRFLATSPRGRFFTNGWNLFDLIVVGAGFVPGAEYFAVLRLLRIVRILRAVSVLPHLQKLATALLRSLPSLGHIVFLLGLLFFAYGAAGTYLFRSVDPENFGSLHRTMLTLFGIVTLEGWVNVMEGVLKHYPMAWIYFVTFIMFGTFISMNLFVGVIVNNLQQADQEEEAIQEQEYLAVLSRIEGKIDALTKRD